MLQEKLLSWSLHQQLFQLLSQNINVDSLLEQLKKYFYNNNINVDSDELYKIPVNQIVSAIPQICSFQSNEKQAILEAKTDKERIEVIESLLKMQLLDENENNTETIN